MFQELRASLSLLIIFTLITGIGYPLAAAGLGQLFFPRQANGSLIEKDGRIIGSELIGQNFSDNKYFHSRPSAAGNGYDASKPSGSNLAPSSTDLIRTIGARVEALRKSGNTDPIPIDLVTASGSGLDPDISVAAANFQAMRVAMARNVPYDRVQDLIVQNTVPRTFGILGENRVNVLSINLALDSQTPVSP